LKAPRFSEEQIIGMIKEQLTEFFNTIGQTQTLAEAPIGGMLV